ncbi:MAG: YggT family protein [Chloroflexota bacterium]
MTLTSLVVLGAQVLTVAIIARALLSWVPGRRALQPLAVGLAGVTDPILEPVRRRVPPLGGLDLSPIIAILLITVVETILVSVLAPH